MSTILQRLPWNGKRYTAPQALRFRIPYKLGWDKTPGAATIPAFPNSLQAGFVTPTNSPAGSPFIIRSLIYEDSTEGTDVANWTVNADLNSQRRLSNGPVHIRTIGGTAKTPAILAEPIFLESRQRFNTVIQRSLDSIGASSGRLVLDGMLLLPNDADARNAIDRWRIRQLITYPFWYVNPAPISGTGADQQFDIKIGDSHFELSRLNAISFDVGESADTEFEFEMTNATTGDTIMNGRVTKENGFGDGNFPGHLPSPLLIERGSIIRWTVKGAVGSTIWPVMVGRKILAPLNKWQSMLKETDDLLEMIS